MIAMSTQFTRPLTLPDDDGKDGATRFEVMVLSSLQEEKIVKILTGSDGKPMREFIGDLLRELVKCVTKVSPAPEEESLENQIRTVLCDEEIAELALQIVRSNTLRYLDIKKSKSLPTSAPEGSPAPVPAT